MKVLITPKEVAGQISILSQTLRSLGIDAHSITLDDQNPLQYKVDNELTLPKNKMIKFIIKVVLALVACVRYNIIHLQGGSAFSSNIDLEIFDFFSKDVVVTYHGSDIRNREYLYSLARGDTFLPVISTAKQQNNIKKVRVKAKAITVTTPDLTRIVEDAVYIPSTVEEKWFEQEVVLKRKNIVRIVHAPTNREIKGTKYVLDAVDRIRQQGEMVELVLVENVPNDQVLELYKTADLAIDQLVVGWYGVFAVENMALGNPVVSNIDLELMQSFAPDLPILNANVDNIYEVIMGYLKLEDSSIQQLRKQTKEYALRKHHPEVVAKRYLELYLKQRQ